VERRPIIAVLAGACLVCGTAVAKADLIIPAPTLPGPNTKLAFRAINAAIQAVADRDHACRLRFSARTGTTTHAPIPQDMLDAFAVLRRPATAQDTRRSETRFPFADGIAVDYVRRARVLPDGIAVYVIPALVARRPLPKRPEPCFARERVALDHRLRGKPAQAQRAARRLLRDYQHSQRAAARLNPQPGLFMFGEDKGGGFGTGGSTVAEIRKRGEFSITAVHGRDSLLMSLIPDGVATIDFTFARGHGIGQGSSRVYRWTYRRSVAVVHNVVALTVPRAPEDAFYSRQVWHAADGSVINVVPAPTAR
jgi:hypothetical protein